MAETGWQKGVRQIYEALSKRLEENPVIVKHNPERQAHYERAIASGDPLRFARENPAPPE